MSTECAAVREFTGTHNMIRGLIRLLESAMAKVKADDAKQLKVLSDFGVFAILGSHFHHSVEDDYYWPALVSNGADRSLLEPLEKEHRLIDPLLDETRDAFAGLKGNPADGQSFRALAVLVERFKEGMLSHLDNEEPVFFPLLTQYMPDDESHKLSVTVGKKAPRQGVSWLMAASSTG